MLYLMDGMPTFAQFRIDRLDVLDVAVALRALAEHDRRLLRPVDVARRKERRRDAVERDLVLVAEILDARRSSTE